MIPVDVFSGMTARALNCIGILNGLDGSEI
jgi:hypothetical protein